MLKDTPSPVCTLLGVTLMVSLSGCAAAYRDYQGCIPYRYCTPSPLPYVAYEGCHCPTPGASLYLEHDGTSGADAPALDAPIEDPTVSESGAVIRSWSSSR